MKSLKNLIIPFIIMMVLIIGLVVWSVLKPSDSDVNGSEAESVDLQILYEDVSSIQRIVVHKQDGTTMGFTSEIDSEGIQKFDIIDEAGADEAFTVSENKVLAYVSTLTNFYANSKLTDVQDLSEYGLDNPSFIIDISTFDGVNHTVKLGNKTPDNSYAYVMVDDDTNVYTVASAKLVYSNYGLIEFLSSQMLNIDYSQISTVEFSRRSDSIDLVADCTLDHSTNEPIYHFLSPFQIKASPYFENLVEYVATLEISSYLDIADDELADYGLDNIAYSFTFNMKDGRTITVDFSDNRDGYYYGKSNITDNYFVLSEIQIVGLDTSLMNLIDSYVCYHTASEISSITGTYGDSTFDFQLNVVNTISDPSSVVTLNQRNAIVYTSSQRNRSYAGILFETFATIQIAGIEYDESSSIDDSVASIKYVTTDHNTVNVDFVPRGTDTYYVYIDGEYSCFFIRGDELFANGGTDTFEYGLFEAVELCRTAIDNQIVDVCDIETIAGENS